MRTSTDTPRARKTDLLRSLVASLLLQACLTLAASAAPFAYVANFSDDTLSVLDVADREVVTTVDVGEEPAGVAVTPDGGRVLVGALGGDEVSILDTSTHTVLGVVPVGEEPRGIAVSPDGSTGWIANQEDDTVTILDLESMSVAGTVAVGFLPRAVDLSPRGDRAYVANTGDDTVSILDVAMRTEIGTIAVGNSPKTLRVSPEGRFLFVAHGSGVDQIDLRSETVVRTLTEELDDPRGLAVSPDGSRLYVGNVDSATVTVFDTANGTLQGTVVSGIATPQQVGSLAQGLDVTPDGSNVLVVNREDEEVAVIDTATLTVDDRIAVGTGPAASGRFIGPGAASCVPGPTGLCLSGDRFRVEVDWATADGESGTGRAFPLTDDTGYFWFFDPANVEVVVKVLDACRTFDRFWVFASGLTNVEVTLRVTDTETGETRTYFEPAESPFAPIQDTEAFATCPE